MNPTLQDENFTLRHDLPGVVTMGNSGPNTSMRETSTPRGGEGGGGLKFPMASQCRFAIILVARSLISLSIIMCQQEVPNAMKAMRQ
jgi:hypothetical protein